MQNDFGFWAEHQHVGSEVHGEKCHAIFEEESRMHSFESFDGSFVAMARARRRDFHISHNNAPIETMSSMTSSQLRRGARCPRATLHEMISSA